MEAWATGAREWNEASKNDRAGFFPVRKAWEEYKPVGLPLKETDFPMPASTAFETVYGLELAGYVAREILPLVEELKTAIAKASDKAPAINRLGVLYARYGLNDEALEQFNQALRLRQHVPSLINKASLLYMEGTYRESLSLYQRVLALQADAPGALLGAARCYHALKNYARVAEPFGRLKVVSPELAAKYPYLDPGGSATTRAADVTGTTRNVTWDYGE
jgi:tetratricopeptide (TPR) repeat protein